MNVQIRRKLALALTMAVVLAGASAIASAQAAKIDITGTWNFTVETDAGGGTPTVTFKQEGEKLTGHYSSQTFGEVDITGTLKGQELTFQFSSEALGAAAAIVYKGTVENNNSMKGTLDLGGAASGTFTAVRGK